MSFVRHLLIFMTYKFQVQTAIRDLNHKSSVPILKFELHKTVLIYMLLYKLDDSQIISLSSHIWKLSLKLELQTLARHSYPLF